LYNYFLNILKKSKLVFSYLCLDELYTFYGNKGNRVYIWSAVGVTKTGRKFYFYHLSKRKDIDSLLSFNFDLPKVDKYYTDGHFAYSNVYGRPLHNLCKFHKPLTDISLIFRQKL
jgi:IS1 family transposase